MLLFLVPISAHHRLPPLVVIDFDDLHAAGDSCLHRNDLSVNAPDHMFLVLFCVGVNFVLFSFLDLAVLV